MHTDIVLVMAPSVLGLRPTGVELMPAALRAAGLAKYMGIRDEMTIEPPPYDARRDSVTGMLNPHGLAEYSVRLADAVQEAVRQGRFPLVLGGDCSIIIGAMLALRRMGRFGLFFMDGHADFYQPAASPTGEAADMDLAIVSGRGPDIVANLENRKPLVRDEDIIAFGQRDRAETLAYGSRQVAETPVYVCDLERIRNEGLRRSVTASLGRLCGGPDRGFWIHVDADVLDDREMPAVDYRMPGGLRFRELSEVLKLLSASGRPVGMSLSIFNPRLDPSGKLAVKLVKSIAAGLGDGLFNGNAGPD